jgi:VWFA-related protein
MMTCISIMRPAGCLALLAVLISPGSAQVKFSTGVDSVRIDAQVTAGGRPLADLTAADFEIRDNGTIQTVSMLGAGSFPVDVVLALDISSSLTPDRLTALQSASRALVDAVTAGDRVELITFNEAVTRPQALTADAGQLREAIGVVAPSGTTAIVDAMYAAIASLRPGDRRALLIVFSDGIDTASWLTPDAVVMAARRTGAVIYAVSTKPRSQAPQLLHDVTNATGGEIFHVDSSRLQTTFVDILNDFRSRYLLSYTLAGPVQPGWHRIEVRVKRRGAVVRTRQGYFVAPGR